MSQGHLSVGVYNQTTISNVVTAEVTKAIEIPCVTLPARNEMGCIPDIDVVYTWVNGSDPRQIAALNAAKRQVLGEIHRICNRTEDPQKDNCTRDEEGANRFQDNNELLYSLRSIEQNANWIRNIYLVTNGQIPIWLNLSNPRIQVITHEQIFLNKSHLPVFSSPAIEANIHRIPGLSEMFLYFNDDTMLGSPVWPDDWYTRSKGQKVFLSWPVPNCNEGCPSNWIADGYCDLACNVSACEWDGGDCRNASAPSGGSNWWNQQGGNRGSERDKKYCAPGCPDSWIGDKYCDRTCRVKDCGYDAGDCEATEIYQNMFGVDLNHEINATELPRGLSSVYFNLSGVVGDNKIVDGSHDNAQLVRTATISQKYKIMTLTFFPDVPRQTVVISLTYDSNGQNVDYSFNVTTDTLKVKPNATLTAAAEASTHENSSSVKEGPATPGNSSPEAPTQIANDTTEDNEATTQAENMQPQAGTPKDNQEALEPEEKPQLKRKVERKRKESTRDHKFSKLTSPRKLLSIEDDEPLPQTDKDTFQILRGMRNLIPDDLLSPVHLKAITKQMEAQFKGQPVSEDILQKWLEISISKYKYVKKMREIDEEEKSKRLNPDQEHNMPDEEPEYPWENLHLIHNALLKRNEGFRSGRTLKALDLYGESLKFVNNKLNKEFGPAPRKVPAHMPHFLQRKLVEDMQNLWPAEFEATSSHKLRDAHDMQYAFSYFYFMIHQKVKYNFTAVWVQYLDMDHSGSLNDNELRTLAVHLHGTPVPANAVQNIKAQLRNCTFNATGEWVEDLGHLVITQDTILNCSEILKNIEKHFSKKAKNKHETLESDEVAFLMIGDNYTNVEKALDGIRERRQKFVCLNDNMNHSNPESKKVVQVLKNFYEALYPLPSSFELPPDKYNKYLYMDEYLEHLEEEKAEKEIQRQKQLELEREQQELKEREEKKRLEEEAILRSQESSAVINLILFCIGICIFCFICTRFVSNYFKRRQSKEQRFLKLINP